MLQQPELGNYPTPVARLSALSTGANSLWIKRDDLTHPLYGGNKVRKLGRVLADARSQGAERIVTVGAVGSHHVLASGIFGNFAGLRVDAALFGQPRSQHALDTLRATAARGVGLFPVKSFGEAAQLLKTWKAEGAYCVPAGGSSRIGTLGVVSAVTELAQQIRTGELPEPDIIVVPLGSGGTVAGLLAGIVQEGLRSQVLGVAIAEPARVFERKARALLSELVTEPQRAEALQRLHIEHGFLGAGYGYASPESDHAKSEAAQCGVLLDDTYTGKAFAAALARVAQGRERNILYWHTLSSASLEPLLVGAPLESELDPALLRLFR